MSRLMWERAFEDTQFVSKHRLSLFKMDKYCCDRKCFKRTETEVDGMACSKCENFSYCKCRCKSFRVEDPTLLMFKMYKTRHLFACCPEACTKFSGWEVWDPCEKCFSKTFCKCILKFCKNRQDWLD